MVVEEGTHNQLMKKSDIYHNLVTKQNSSGVAEERNDELVLESLTEVAEDVELNKEQGNISNLKDCRLKGNKTM